MSSPLFQTVSTSDSYPRIADRDTVNNALGLYSDHLNWNTQPDIELMLRDVLCMIFGHSPYPGPPMTWKPRGYCYWCFKKVEEST